MLRSFSKSNKFANCRKGSITKSFYRFHSNDATSEEIRAKIQELKGSTNIPSRRAADIHEDAEGGAVSKNVSTLKFQSIRHSETFGQIVRSEKYEREGLLDDQADANIRIISIAEQSTSPFRNLDGSPIKGGNAQEARLHEKTLLGRAFRPPSTVPDMISKTINNEILSSNTPGNLRREAAKLFVDLKRNDLHKSSANSREADAHIASFFIQNYGSIYQALYELKSRKGELFNPQSVLDIGFGPATGMAALNELMGDHFKPAVKDAVVVGSHEMRKRAKIILSRQICEQVNESNGDEVAEFGVSETGAPIETEEEHLSREERAPVGSVDVSKIKIKTRVTDSLSITKKYDLIIATHQLLNRESGFPSEVDQSIEYILQCLAPGGNLVLIERGNPLGFETIARARQVMIRPENFEPYTSKIPRPWIRGSTKKPKNNSSVSGLEENDSNDLLNKLESKFGAVSEEDLKFDNEEEFEMLNPTNERVVETGEVDYHLKVLAPCSHHAKCPLQISKPEYYTYPQGKKLNWCHFPKVNARPKFSRELKKGLILSTPWATSESGTGIKGLAPTGSGRAHGNNTEVSTYSYLIMERSMNDSESIKKIMLETESPKHYPVGYSGDEPNEWPRIMRHPMKRKGHVTMELCGPSGSIEKWVVSKSFGAQEFHDARKASSGDLWALDSKTKLLSSNTNDKYLERLENHEKSLKIAKRKEHRLVRKNLKKEQDRKTLAAEVEGGIDSIAEAYADALENTKKQKQYDKKKGIDGL